MNGSSVISPTTTVPTSTSLTTYHTSTDGEAWMKVSPSGKLSNQADPYSQRATEPAPACTAVRDSTMLCYAQLDLDDAGILTSNSYGVVGDGSAPVLVDSFQFINDDLIG